MTSPVYRGHKSIIKQPEETMKDFVAPPLILHWTYDNYLFAVVKFDFSRPFSEYGTWTQ